MSKGRKRNIRVKKVPNPNVLTYAQALEATGKARLNLIAAVDPLQADLGIGSHTQAKLQAIVGTLDNIGRWPGDFPREKFDQAITYRKLPPKAVDWLVKAGIPAKSISPFATSAYRDWFARTNNYPISEEIIEKFFSHLIHCLVVETQIIIAKQYYQGLDLYRPKLPSLLEAFPNIAPEFKAELQEAYDVGTDKNTIEFHELHGRIFLDYCVVMIRAQWDKLVSLNCLIFGLNQNWKSIFDGLNDLERHISTLDGLNPGCKAYFKIFSDIANERLAEGAWLKTFRDSLMHGVGQHSLGVVPHRKSSYTTSEFWDKMCEEHNWLREAMMTMLVVFAFYNSKDDKSKE